MQVIKFEKTDGTYTLRDSIVLKDDHGLTDDQIEAIKQQRFDKWLAIITAVPDENAPIVDPIIEETPPADPVV